LTRKEESAGVKGGKSYVFISYSRKDLNFTRKLVNDLTASGVPVWLDVDQISPGAQWGISIGEGLSGAAAFLYVSSVNSRGSVWMGREIVAAASRFYTPLIIPIILDDEGVTALPSPLERYQWVDFRSSYEEAFDSLLRALSGRIRSSEPLPKRVPTKGYVFLNYAEEDSDLTKEIILFLKDRGYAYWEYESSDRNYQASLGLELEERISGAAAMLSILSPAWKRSEWAVKEYLYSVEVRTPVFLLRLRDIGPTLIIAGIPYIDFLKNRGDGFSRLDRELRRNGLV
jgi:hypothetical protein